MKVVVGLGSCGIAAGANKVFDKLQSEITERELDIDLQKTGCVGMCHLEPIIDIYDNENNLERYVKVSDKKVIDLLDTALKGEIYRDLKIDPIDSESQDKQVKISTENCGI